MVELHANGNNAEWWNPNSINTIFFFISGMFFSSKADFKEFSIKKIRTILVPFLWFYILSYPIYLIYNYWDFRTFTDLPYNSILDIFKIVTDHDYLSINVPLWFLPCLFFCEMIYYPISKLPRWAIWGILAIIALFGQQIYSTPMPFMINNAIYWLIFFGCGKLLGQRLISLLNNKRLALIISSLGLGVCISLYLYLHGMYFIPPYCKTVLIYLPYCIALTTISSLIPQQGVIYHWFANYIGANTLIILCIHRWIEIPVCRISYMLTRTYSPSLAILSALITTLLLIPMIKIINNKFSFLIGNVQKESTANNIPII